MSRLQALVLLGCTALQLCWGLDNGVARKPQMGFAPWNFAGVHSTCYVTACCNFVCQTLEHRISPGHWPGSLEYGTKQQLARPALAQIRRCPC